MQNNFIEKLKKDCPEILIPPKGKIPEGYIEVCKQYDKDIDDYFTVVIPEEVARERGIDF